MAFVLAPFALALAALVPAAEGCWLKPLLALQGGVEGVEDRTVDFSLVQEPQLNDRNATLVDNKRGTVAKGALGKWIVAMGLEGPVGASSPWLWAVVAISTSFGVARVLRRRRGYWREHVAVHVLGGGKTKLMQCGALSSVGAMRETMGVPLDAVILLV
eukprot:CAMPEP_0175989404 /NCGR_PEP_ID=MMETSP0108-20121206/51749_1 /TAXON_ID=195067 ORGANISM="Goniomonas pacifica, Strain CCMP1869" /NCGR_SAMPLE_ID=MMETSP0108 /ASSEMBLY_ACC=CAM_ASM_000204 /LENGTH=158 /DNA_ID=CAMNT_0017320795 /DNA_START=8 /DNA_END=482 /DNA_ORIENTATION=-